ncbi:hypothetical protein [Amycolatopsis azurea]|uniref:Uncharacterized protein n=1 Tax=Amycolatopsis azurea DSM 43854 TaxID=1238180 RepID=M2NPH8_9PSEU|nr:hypothetical protein [Amycolatopsis azurea]EMD24144.1 hypothetical protein C791_6222 [Amycolatopsis azurea DSM 43854]OOC08025.1 hypothetical protein B0293_03825 [Amycolatopsis azurea DSM 43854]
MTSEVKDAPGRDLTDLKVRLAEALRVHMTPDFSAEELDTAAVMEALDRAIAVTGLDEDEAAALWESFVEVVEQLPEATKLDDADLAEMIAEMTMATD